MKFLSSDTLFHDISYDGKNPSFDSDVLASSVFFYMRSVPGRDSHLRCQRCSQDVAANDTAKTVEATATTKAEAQPPEMDSSSS
jgi:hypothetical protein